MKTFSNVAWFKNARFRVTFGISGRILIGPELNRLYASPCRGRTMADEH
jgi:hypothetical protein